jgi:hypothetical protein
VAKPPEPVILDLKEVGGLSPFREGGSLALRFHTSPQRETFQWILSFEIVITGTFLPISQLMAITKNGMTVDGSGNIADSSGTALAEGAQIGSGQVLVAGQIPIGYSKAYNFPVKRGEIVYVTKNQANPSFIVIYYDLV